VWCDLRLVDLSPSFLEFLSQEEAAAYFSFLLFFLFFFSFADLLRARVIFSSFFLDS